MYIAEYIRQRTKSFEIYFRFGVEKQQINMLRRLRLRRLGLRGVTVSAVLVRSAPCVREVEIMVIETDVHVVIRL